MIWRSLHFIFFIFLTIVLNANAQQITIKRNDNFSASFHQTKFLRSTGITLNSSGTIIYRGDSELIWHQTMPFENKVIIKNGDFNLATAKKETNPFMEKISTVFHDLLS